MRGFFGILKNSSETTSQQLPSLPSDLSYSEFTFKTTRGFLAKKIDQYTGMNNSEGDELFYHSLTKSSFNHLNNENRIERILYLSELMLKWHDQQIDLVNQINNLPINNDLKNAMFKAHSIYKKEIFSPMPDLLKPYELQQNQSEWEVYRDVIFAATQGQFLLITEEEVNQYKEGKVFCQGKVKERSDIPACRNLAKATLEQKGFNKTKMMSWLLVLSEAITNTIKHAEGGKMTLIENDKNSEIRFVIEDKGPGFSLKELPETTLMAGYSTKKSMGQGFTLMMKIAKQVLLCTSTNGSTIILTFDSRPE